MAAVLESNKNKIAKRVIEVFAYFGENNRTATVMDIVRRYDRPQSSTSELLASLVEMGLLYKNPASRSYTPTPRMPTLGSAAQPEVLRDGQLYTFMDRLARSTRSGVGLFGIVGTHTQIFRWSCSGDTHAPLLRNGDSERLSGSTVGLLLMSTMGITQARKVLWRLQAEMPEAGRFDYAEMVERVVRYARQGAAAGAAGFETDSQIVSVLLRREADEPPLAIGVVIQKGSDIDIAALTATLQQGIQRCTADESGDMLQPARMLRAL